MIRSISSIIFCTTLSGCALDPVSTVLLGTEAFVAVGQMSSAAMYTQPVVDPMGGLTPEKTGAVPSSYRKFDCQELSAKLKLHQDVMGKIHPSDTVGRTSLQWDIDAIATVMNEKQCSSSNSVATSTKKVTGTATQGKKNTTKTTSETIVSEAVQPKDNADPHCFALFQPVYGESPRALLAAPAPTPDAHVSYDVMARRFQQFIALAHQVQPGVWHKDIAGPDCNVGEGLCTGTAYRHIFGPSHLAMLFCESSKEASVKSFESLKASLTSPHVVEWSD